MIQDKIRVGVLGATGLVGQYALSLLQNHPWFEVVFVAASSNSAGKTLKAAIGTKRHVALTEQILSLPVHDVSEVRKAEGCRFIFSCLATEAALDWEPAYALQGACVLSNASAFRRESDVCVFIPEINPQHLAVKDLQQRQRGFSGCIITKPNCSVQSYLLPIHLLNKHVGVEKVLVTTMQAVSGSGYPGVSALDIQGNVIPYIDGEDDKSENEPLKILGDLNPEGIQKAKELVFSAQCNRVNVRDGHLASVSVQTKRPVSPEEFTRLVTGYTSECQQLKLPSAPLQAITVHTEAGRPQPYRDASFDKGMGLSIGHIKPCKVLGLRFVGLSHNVLRGAAGGSVLSAEYLVATKRV